MPRHLLPLLLLLPLLALGQTAHRAELRGTDLVVTNETDSRALSALYATNTALRAAVNTEQGYRLAADAELLEALNATNTAIAARVTSATGTLASATAASLATATGALWSASQALIANVQPTRLFDTANGSVHLAINHGTATVYRIALETNYTVSLSPDFLYTVTGTRPAWTNNVFPYADSEWKGEIRTYLCFYHMPDNGLDYWYSDLSTYPATLNPNSLDYQGTATISQTVFYATNVLHVAATTNDVDRLRAEIATQLAALPATLQPATSEYFGNLASTNTAGYSAVTATNQALAALVTSAPAEAQSLARFRLDVSSPLSGIITASAYVRADYFAGDADRPTVAATLSRYTPAGTLLAAETGDTVAIASEGVSNVVVQLALSSPVTNGYLVAELLAVSAAPTRTVRVLSGGVYPLRLSSLNAPLNYLTWSDALALFAPKMEPVLVAPTFASSVTLAGETITNWPSGGGESMTLTNGVSIFGGWSNAYATVTMRHGTTNLHIVIKAP